MKAIILLIITTAFALPAFFLAARYNLHMLQLNGYKAGEQLNWLKKNWRKQWILSFTLICGILLCLFRSTVLGVFGCLGLWLSILVFKAHRNLNQKKKLVYTARVKRLMATLSILALALIALGAIFLSFESWPAVPVIIAGAAAVLVYAANLINKPLEKAINTGYILDAKKKLKRVKGIKVIGITGSYGKTSVKFYLKTLLQGSFQVLATPGSFNTPMGVVRTIRESLLPTHEIFLCEMGARYRGDIKEICDIVHPDMGIITSIGPQHLETFGDISRIQDTKFELADSLPEGGLIFLNGGNELIMERASKYKDKVLYYTENSPVQAGENAGGYRAFDIRVSRNGTSFAIAAPDGERESFETRLIGAHNVINIVGAVAIAHSLGIGLRELKIPVRRIRSVEHRMEIKDQGDVTIIDDAYNSNPVGSKAAVETLALFDGLRILITPGMVELGREEEAFNKKFGYFSAPCCDYILLVGKKARTDSIREGALENGFPEKKCLSFDSLADAMGYARSIKDTGHKYILLENDLPDNY